MPSRSLSQATKDTTTSNANEVVKEILHSITTTWKTSKKWHPLYDTYRDLHRNPGVSGHEDYAADCIEKQLKSIKESLQQLSNLSLQIKRDIGRAESGASVVAVLRNSNGQTTSQPDRIEPVVLLRADIDALPVDETTG